MKVVQICLVLSLVFMIVAASTPVKESKDNAEQENVAAPDTAESEREGRFFGGGRYGGYGGRYGGYGSYGGYGGRYGGYGGRYGGYGGRYGGYGGYGGYGSYGGGRWGWGK